ncbi:MAG: ATPase [Planctomycetes bacterium]|nr:ATPase [Planctomycetota bacterium]
MEHKGIVVFESKHVRRVWHNEKRHFSVVDVCGALTGSDNPAVYWRVLKKRLKDEGADQTVTECNGLKLAEDVYGCK